MRKAKGKIKNFILKTITYFAALLFLVSACAVDSPSWIPTIVCCVCMIWLTLFAYANSDYFEDYDFEDGDC